MRRQQRKWRGITTFIISHRITTLSKADKIIVLDGGRIAEEGTPDELKTSGGIYNKIYDIQSGIDADLSSAAGKAPEGKEADHENN